MLQMGSRDRSGNQIQHQAGLKKEHAFSNGRMNARHGTGANAVLRKRKGFGAIKLGLYLRQP